MSQNLQGMPCLFFFFKKKKIKENFIVIILIDLNIEKETREKLLKQAKKEVKQIMEIAVVVKFIHEDNNAITSLCGIFKLYNILNLHNIYVNILKLPLNHVYIMV